MKLSAVMAFGCRVSAMFLVFVGGLAVLPLQAQELSVCVEAHARLDGNTVRVFEEELQGIARKSGLSLRFLQNQSNCPEIRIRIQAQGQKEISALGAARVLHGRIQPELEIYATPVAI